MSRKDILKILKGHKLAKKRSFFPPFRGRFSSKKRSVFLSLRTKILSLTTKILSLRTIYFY
jgi:hypothetical protein